MSLTHSTTETMRCKRANASTPSLVILGVVTWGALVAGILIALGGFADPRPLYNGWVRMMALAAALWTLIWVARTIHPGRAQLLKLAVVGSLIAHTMLAAVLYRQRLEFRMERSISERVQGEQTPDDLASIRLEHQLNIESSRAAVKVSSAPSTPPLAPQDEQLRQVIATPNFAFPLIFTSEVANGASPPIAKLGASARRRMLNDHVAGSLTAAPAIQSEAIELPRVNETSDTPTPEVAEAFLAPQGDGSVLSRATLPMVVGLGRHSAHSLDMRLTELSQATRDVGEALDAPRMLERRHVAAAPLPGAERNAMRSGTLARSHVERPRHSKQAFAERMTRRRRKTGNELNGASTGQLVHQSDLAIERGLGFLARIQLEDGHWEFTYLGADLGEDSLAAEPASIQADAAATGLALLSFLGAGHDHFGGRYQLSVQHAIDYLLRVQSPSGEMFPESDRPIGQVTRFYSHGIATLALCEAYGMTGDPQLERPATAAIEYLANTQHEELGGWRYVAGTNADLSVTGWQFLAIRSAELAGVQVSPRIHGRIEACLEKCRDESGERALFRYNPWASPTDPQTRHGREPSTVMTSVGLLMQLHLDADRASPRLRLAADHLLANLPQQNATDAVAQTGTLGNPGRDTYYWYYATQAMYLMGGKDWQVWSERLFPLLADSQETGGPHAGSWDPRRPVPDKWAPYAGRLYVTAMNLLSLEAADRSLLVDSGDSPRVAKRR